MDAQIIKHFRVDRMMNISLTDQARAGREYFDRFDLARYTKRTFGMFGGKGRLSGFDSIIDLWEW